MSMAALLRLDGGEVILILGLVLALFGAKRLPEIGEGLWQAIRELIKTTGELTKELTGREACGLRPQQSVGMAVISVLGTACFIWVIYEYSK